MATESIFHQAVVAMLREVLDGPPGDFAFVLNPGDRGLLANLESIGSDVASTRPMPGRTTIAQHAAHVLYGLELLNRWASGEENPWASADWDAAWKTGRLNEDQWRDLVGRLRTAAQQWVDAVDQKASGWDQVSANGAVASAVHTAYHLGAIRQLMAASTPA